MNLQIASDPFTDTLEYLLLRCTEGVSRDQFRNAKLGERRNSCSVYCTVSYKLLYLLLIFSYELCIVYIQGQPIIYAWISNAWAYIIHRWMIIDVRFNVGLRETMSWRWDGRAVSRHSHQQRRHTYWPKAWDQKQERCPELHRRFPREERLVDIHILTLPVLQTPIDETN